MLPETAVVPRRREIAVFVILAFGIPWLLWVLRRLTGVDAIAPGGMLAAGLATFVAVRWVRRSRDIRRETAMAPLRPARPLLRYCLIGLLLPLAFGFASIGIGALAGVYPLDLTGFGALRSTFAPGTVDEQGMPIGLILSALAINVGLLLILLPLAFCEEWAWRGYLLPVLRPFGLWPALLLSGLIWGLWHLPGFIGSQAAPRTIPFMITAVFFGVLLGWLRLASGLIWPGVIAHAVNNTLITGFVNAVFGSGDLIARSNPWTIGLSGWPGWLVMLAVIAVLVARGALPGRKTGGTANPEPLRATRTTTPSAPSSP
ncbi:CPBP family intramembrane metalloprotease [Sphaerisporangium sp. TRM90804]|uniref:CPBP family intramembrane glutamic endopeptidase n=1 Tax=Sphaerisporangium sp. TRM90804 TaxID=3031113 RepID=UPI002447F9B3|nr:CPBP family intramembrane metalloprotease [Sphaerisporangium sp. TRM90804]MDH2430555.1 CPBP family intramembrane metalloprotease [Sphaerisporangium sp. TRM90804]